MNDVQFVAVANGRDGLSKDAPREILLYAVWMLHDVVVQVPSIAKFLNQVELRLRVDDLVEANDARVGDQLHTANLLVEVSSRHFVQFVFVDDFDGHAKAGKDVTRALDDGEMAGA